MPGRSGGAARPRYAIRVSGNGFARTDGDTSEITGAVVGPGHEDGRRAGPRGPCRDVPREAIRKERSAVPCAGADAVGAASRTRRFAAMKLKSVIVLCATLALAACGGGDLSIDLPGRGEARTLRLEFPPRQAVERELPFRVSGGVAPHTSSIEGCPDWVTLLPDQGILAGTAPETERGRTFFCANRVRSAMPGASWSRRACPTGFVSSSGPRAPILTLPPPDNIDHLTVGTYHGEALPAAMGGAAPHTYSLTCVGGALPPGMGFAAATRMFAGTPQGRFRDSCTYKVTDSASPPATFPWAVEIEVSGAIAMSDLC